MRPGSGNNFNQSAEVNQPLLVQCLPFFDPARETPERHAIKLPGPPAAGNLAGSLARDSAGAVLRPSAGPVSADMLVGFRDKTLLRMSRALPDWMDSKFSKSLLPHPACGFWRFANFGLVQHRNNQPGARSAPSGSRG
jgi:hypothetical protein